jgi:hypothetical protein
MYELSKMLYYKISQKHFNKTPTTGSFSMAATPAKHAIPNAPLVVLPIFASGLTE